MKKTFLILWLVLILILTNTTSLLAADKKTSANIVKIYHITENKLETEYLENMKNNKNYSSETTSKTQPYLYLNNYYNCNIKLYRSKNSSYLENFTNQKICSKPKISFLYNQLSAVQTEISIPLVYSASLSENPTLPLNKSRQYYYQKD